MRNLDLIDRVNGLVMQGWCDAESETYGNRGLSRVGERARLGFACWGWGAARRETANSMKRNVVTLGAMALVAVGCIHTHNTVTKDEGRMPVEFENDGAARVFYETLSRMPGAGDSVERRSEISLPLVFSHEEKVVRGPNVGFNEAVRRCDTNQDGKITESEARIFAATVR